MSMFTHIVIGTDDPRASALFYNATFAALGVAGNQEGDASYFGSYEEGFFSVNRPRNGEAATFANGGSDEGAPGRRDMGDNKLYGAYLRDPIGNKLCVFTTNVED